MILADVIGYAGDAVLIGGYSLLVTGRCCGYGPIYNGAKLVGYSSVAFNGFAHKSYPLVALGTVYCGLAILALVRHWRVIVK